MAEENNNEPIVSDEEMKMPEESFGAVEAEPNTASHLGFILGALIIILVLLLGGLYLWSTTFNQETEVIPEATRPTAAENNEPESTNAEAQVETMGALSTSNSLDAIDADLDSTDTTGLDVEMTDIETELTNSGN